ncbi:RidA family protein [Dongia mobilis]|uniref:RidA family protein n=1 Tax=Dongia sp. TaxID=1977262 RepID=UPI0026F27D41
MADRYLARLRELGFDLPPVGGSGGNYVPSRRTGNLLYISGQISAIGDEITFAGKLGAEVTVAEGRKAAELCALNLVAQLSHALGGNLDRLKACVRLGGFVNCTPGFDQQSEVMNGASDLMVALFGERGRHARTSIGVANLPVNASVEVDGIFEIAD